MHTTFVCTSDIHMLHEKIDVPFADVFVCAGDMGDAGTLEESQEVLAWIAKLPHSVRIVTPGNHDGPLQDAKILEKLRSEFPNITILIDQTITINGLKIHASPWVPGTPVKGEYPWAFDIWSLEGRMSKWNMIPDDVDVLITHTPALGSRDTDRDNVSRGCSALDFRRARLNNLKLHIFGHIHSSAGTEIKNGITLVNAAIALSDEEVRKPIVVSVENKKFSEV